jgi:hypothetical protein
MSSYRIQVQQLERVTKAIGYICVYWAWLEDQIGEMILDLAPLDKHKLLPKEIEQIRDVFLVDADIRTKIKVLRAIAFIRKWDDAWFNQVDKILNKIDNDLRPKRNRAVHSSWFVPRPGRRLVRHSKQAKLKKPQAFAKEELSTKERVPVKMRDLWNLGRSLIAAQIRLVQLLMRHEAIQKHIDADIQKKVAESDAQTIWDGLTPDLLRQLLLAKSVQQILHPKSPDTRPKNTRLKRPPRPRSEPK